MDRTKKLETATAVIEWLTELVIRKSSGTYQLGRTYRGCDKDDRWYLQNGTGWTAYTYYVPTEVGTVLAETWKKSEWGYFIGFRGAKRILRDLGVADSVLAGKVKAAQAAAEAAKLRRVAEHRIKAIDEFVARHGEWLSVDTKVALENESVQLTAAVIQ